MLAAAHCFRPRFRFDDSTTSMAHSCERVFEYLWLYESISSLNIIKAQNLVFRKGSHEFLNHETHHQNMPMKYIEFSEPVISRKF